MVKIIFAILFISTIIINAQEYTLEAEDGVLTGVEIATATSGYSGTGYVTGWEDNGTDQVTVTFNAPAEDTYQIKIGFATPYGAKSQELIINGSSVGIISFPQSDDFTSILGTTMLLPAGDNTITIRTSWGWFLLDKFEISTQDAHDYTLIAPNLIDPNANQKTVDVYNFLKSNYGNYTISGQTIESCEGIISATGKSFVIKGFDFGSYSPKFAWAWDNGNPAFAPVDYGQVDSIINWYNRTDACGIPTVHWHWYSPSGGTIRTNTFKTSNTTFDLSQAIIPGTTEFNEVIRDIDSISSKLKILQNAGIPILWRPLHEAGGGWFWWSDEGRNGVNALWDIMYDRMTNYHHLHNLIWVWSTPEASYYLGDGKIDIYGMDSYPGANNYTTQKSYFDQMYETCNGKKIIAMTENGPIPDIDNCFSGDAKWAYFLTWDNFYDTQNSSQHVLDTYNHEKVITLAEACQMVVVENNEIEEFKIYPNPATNNLQLIINNEQLINKNIAIYDIYGKVIKQIVIANETWQSLSTDSHEQRSCNNIVNINVADLQTGVYFLKIGTTTKKFIIK